MRETHNFIWIGFHNFYHQLFVWILRWPKLTFAVIVLVMAAGLSHAGSYGTPMICGLRLPYRQPHRGHRSPGHTGLHSSSRNCKHAPTPPALNRRQF
jgi:hypothetical protein